MVHTNIRVKQAFLFSPPTVDESQIGAIFEFYPKKAINRDFMMVEKHLGFYRPDDNLFLEDGTCSSCKTTVTWESYEEIK